MSLDIAVQEHLHMGFLNPSNSTNCLAFLSAFATVSLTVILTSVMIICLSVPGSVRWDSHYEYLLYVKVAYKPLVRVSHSYRRPSTKA